MKIAGIQMDIAFANREANLHAMHEMIQRTIENGAQLTIFPECTTTGYCFETKEQAAKVAEPLSGPTLRWVIEKCRLENHHVVFGFLETHDGEIYNSAVLVGPEGVLFHYRKTHLPFLGVDRFVTAGHQPYKTFALDGVNMGLGICYDSSFPEFSRSLALLGADIIILPTNWPPTSTQASQIIPVARAMENHVYFAAINRIGKENEVEFIGRSRICAPNGATLAMANHADSAILYAEIDPSVARQKHIVTTPGQHEVHRMRDRRPDLYQRLVAPKEVMQEQ